MHTVTSVNNLQRVHACTRVNTGMRAMLTSNHARFSPERVHTVTPVNSLQRVHACTRVTTRETRRQREAREAEFCMIVGQKPHAIQCAIASSRDTVGCVSYSRP